MFEEYLDQFNINLELERFYALEKRCNYVLDGYDNQTLDENEYINAMEEMSAELDDLSQTYKDVLDGGKKREMTDKVKQLKEKIDGLINHFYGFGV